MIRLIIKIQALRVKEMNAGNETVIIGVMAWQYKIIKH